jgi:hypothetical protein
LAITLQEVAEGFIVRLDPLKEKEKHRVWVLSRLKMLDYQSYVITLVDWRRWITSWKWKTTGQLGGA